MSTSMPYRTNITVERADVEELRSRGPRALLVWEGRNDRVKVSAPGCIPGPEAMIITGHEEINRMLAAHDADGLECTSDDIAQCFTDLARDGVEDWTLERAFTASGHELRKAMARSGLYLTAAPEIQRQSFGVTFTDTYRWSQEPLLGVSLTTISNLGLLRTATVWHDRSGEVAELMIGTGGPRAGLAPAAVTGAITAVMADFIK